MSVPDPNLAEKQKSARRTPTSAQSDVDYPPPALRERIGWSYTGVNILRLSVRFDSDQETQLSHITSEERTNVSMDHETATLSSPSPNPSPSRKQA